MTQAVSDQTLVPLLRDEMVASETLEERYGALLMLVEVLLGVVPNCDRYLEIWPPAFRAYNVMVPNFFNLPAPGFGVGGAPGIVPARSPCARSAAVDRLLDRVAHPPAGCRERCDVVLAERRDEVSFQTCLEGPEHPLRSQIREAASLTLKFASHSNRTSASSPLSRRLNSASLMSEEPQVA